MRTKRILLLPACLALVALPAWADVRWDGVFLQTDFANSLALASGPNLGALPSANHFVFAGGYIGSIASPLNTNNVIELTPTNICWFGSGMGRVKTRTRTSQRPNRT